MQEIFDIVFHILFWPCFVYASYYALMAIVSLIFHSQNYPMVEDKSRFCIFVPCHNEEDVIAATVQNYTHLNYNPELFDIFFLADNCSDKTADRIKEAIEKANKSNFHVLERNVNDQIKEVSHTHSVGGWTFLKKKMLSIQSTTCLLLLMLTILWTLIF